MFPALGAASAAIDALKSLTSSKSSSTTTTGFTQAASNPFDLSEQHPGFERASSTTYRRQRLYADLAADHERAARCAEPVRRPASTTSASTTAAPTDASSALKDLFSQIDANGDGQITKSEFENALGAGGTNIQNADNVFSKLDANGDGSVSLDEMSKALQGAGGKGGHHHHHHATSAAGSSDPATPMDQQRRIEHRSAAGGAARRFLDLHHQQRWLDHDVPDLRRRIQGHDDDAGEQQLVELGDLVL